MCSSDCEAIPDSKEHIEHKPPLDTIIPAYSMLPSKGGQCSSSSSRSSILDNSKQLHILNGNVGECLDLRNEKDRNLVFLELLAAGYTDSIKTLENGREVVNDGLASRFKNCGKFLGNMVCSKGHKTAIKSSCGLAFCPKCRSKRMGKLSNRFIPVFHHMKRPRFLTLTVPNVYDLRGGFVALGKAFAKLRRSKSFSGVVGGIYSRETTLTDNQWNIHIHLLYDGFLNFKEVSESWRKLTGSKWIFDEKADKNAVLEVIGYCGKVPVFPSARDYLQYFKATSKLRLTQSFGTCFNFKYPEFEFACPVCGCTDLHREDPYKVGGEGYDPPGLEMSDVDILMSLNCRE